MDIKLHFKEKGKGFPLLLLHGNGEDLSYFEHQMAYFSDFYRVIAVDTRGHGLSPRGVRPFNIRQFAEDLLAFMDDHAIPKAHLLGFSDGGNIALIFALRHPERVERLVLNGANLNGYGVKPSVQVPILCRYLLAKAFSQKSSKAKEKAEMLGLMVNDPNIKAERLCRIANKTLVIAGNQDMIRENHTKYIYHCLPNAQLEIISGDHFIAQKNPCAFNRTVARFLAEKD